VTLASAFFDEPGYVSLLYLVAFALLIFGLMGLRAPRSAVLGNRVAALGMAIALVATLLVPHLGSWWLIALGIVLGALVGAPAARLVKMTAMPQMVALFNGVGGGAVALISLVEFRKSGGYAGDPLYVACFSLLAALIGSISFWGSNIAFGKLQGLLPGRPITLGRPQEALNALLFLAALGCGISVLAGQRDVWLMLGLLIAAALLGNAIVLPIGGADMPVVISLLNAFTGLSTAATGVALNSTALIVAGMIVGASGSILTNEMAVAMNRSIRAIVAGGFGGVALEAASGEAGERVARATSVDDVAVQLAYANRVVVVPGYGMAVAQAQHAVVELARLLEDRGVEVEYAIHPVAGRMPGHMNVLLAEAGAPYEQLIELDEANERFPRTDVTLVIGANDVVNPDAKNKPDSPIYGMPILDASASRSVVVLKRSMATGYAGVENPLFYEPQTAMLFGDAKQSVTELTAAVKEL